MIENDIKSSMIWLDNFQVSDTKLEVFTTKIFSFFYYLNLVVGFNNR